MSALAQASLGADGIWSSNDGAWCTAGFPAPEFVISGQCYSLVRAPLHLLLLRRVLGRLVHEGVPRAWVQHR